MTISIDPITHKKLVLVRQIYEEALTKSHSTHNNVDMIMAVVGFDLAVETTIKAIFTSLETKKTPELEFQPLIQKTDNLLADKQLDQLPDKAQIQHIHNIRNDAQHKAKYPNPSDVSDCRTYARDFLQKIVKQVWNLEFDKISLAETIKNNDVRNYLIKAETELRNNQTNEAVKAATLGFNKALTFVSAAIIGRDSLIPSMSYGFVLSDNRGKTKIDESSLHAFKRMRDTLFSLALGINYYDFNKFKRITIGIIQIGNTVTWMNEPEKIDKNDAEFIITFVLNNVVRIENMVGDLDKPFGSDRWFWF